MKKLLFIDDDKDFLKSNQLYFSKKNYEVLCTTSPKKALTIVASTSLDCIILDIDMPAMNGFELCQRLRDISGVPIIFLSGYSETKNRIASFKAGGDDFLAKPYDILELELRIESRIRRIKHIFFHEIIHYGKLSIDPNRRIITYDTKTGNFSALQFDIILFLARNPKKVFSYEQLYDCVWKSPIVKSRHNLQVTISTIRQKLMELCDGKQYIQTVPRKGYQFIPDGISSFKR